MGGRKKISGLLLKEEGPFWLTALLRSAVQPYPILRIMDQTETNP